MMLELNRIYQGNCLDLMKSISDKSIDMILCDLPYGTTACKWDTVIPFEPLWLQYKRIIKDNGAIVLTASQPFTTDLINSNRDWFKYELIWEKNNTTGAFNAKRQPLKKHENILIFYINQPVYNPQKIKRSEEEYKLAYRYNDSIYGKQNGVYGYQDGTKKRIRPSKEKQWYKNPESILKIKRDDIRNGQNHPTQKPVTLFEYLIKTYTNDNDLVLDNCIGSGTTAIACLQTNRNFIGIELEEKYVEIANKRMADFKQQLVLA